MDAIIQWCQLGLVSSGAATEGVTPVFSKKNWRPFLVITVCLSVSSAGSLLPCLFPLESPYLFPSEKLLTVFAHNCHFYSFHSGVTPLPEGVTLHLFNLSNLVCLLLFVKSPTQIFFLFGCHSWRVSPGAVRPLVTPLPESSYPPSCMLLGWWNTSDDDDDDDEDDDVQWFNVHLKAD